MRVLLVANTLPPADISGAGEQVVQLAWGLRQLGHEVHVLGRGPGGARGPKLLFPATVLPAALATIRRLRPDVVQLHESDGGLLAVALRLLRRWLPPFVLVALLQVSYREERRAVRPLIDRDSDTALARPTVPELWFRWFRAPSQQFLGQLTGRLSDLVFAPSERTGDELRRDYRVRAVTVLPNVTGAPLPAVAGAVPAVAGAVLGAATISDDPTDEPSTEDRDAPFLFVGRFRIRKGIEVLLAAFAVALAAHPEMRLWLVGAGERAVVLRRRIAAGGLGSQVEMLGRRSPAEVAAMIPRARAVVVPSTYEGMPLVVLEAMRAGRPVIATRVSGMPEVVIDGETGWLVEPERVADLAAALSHAWTDDHERRRRGAAGRRRQLERYQPIHAARIWENQIQAWCQEGEP